MIGFKQFLLETEQLDERVVRTGASLAFAAQGRRHGEEAVQAYKAAKQALTGYAFKSGEEKVDAVADALIKLLDGLIATRRQIGAVSGQLTLKWLDFAHLNRLVVFGGCAIQKALVQMYTNIF